MPLINLTTESLLFDSFNLGVLKKCYFYTKPVLSLIIDVIILFCHNFLQLIYIEVVTNIRLGYLFVQNI
jgi:hypothetical protein